MSAEHARAVVTWSYPSPYDMYDMTGAEIDELTDPGSGFHAVLSGVDLVGFRSFGVDGRVPGWDYDDDALDMGGGLRPDLVGRGLGRGVLAAGLSYGRSVYRPPAFRVTVATLNVRALRVVRALGFATAGGFVALEGTRQFEVLVRQESGLRS